MSEETKSYLVGILTGVLLIIAIISVCGLVGVIDVNAIFKNAKKNESVVSNQTQKAYDEALSYINHYYMGDVEDSDMQNSLIKGLVGGLDDKYADYYDPQETEEFYENINGEFRGIGIVMTKPATASGVIVLGVMDDSPAKKSGVKPGDLIMSIDNKELADLSLDEIKAIISKKSIGSEIALNINRKGINKSIKVKVEDIETKSVGSLMLSEEIGYIRITSFDQNTSEQFKDELIGLENKGMKKLIIDLRNNGGGIVDVATEMLDLLIPKGKLLVYTLDKYKNKKTYTSSSDEEENIPMVVLVNGETASASEIFTGALKDQGKATIIGKKTYGKGIVQSTYELEDKTLIKFTTAKYYTPSGKCIHKKGITPDISLKKFKDEEVTFSEKKEEMLEDTYIKYAFDYIEKED
ncbi:MAG: S41 family peptidase [Lachnospiraceae bacterium]|nr:S41 family peptidase [Lachnospiraceae bacterium]